jgi:hypothetical protein
MTYIFSVLFMCATSIRWWRSSNVTYRLQVFSKNSAPVSWSEGCPGPPSAPRFCRVRILCRLSSSPHLFRRFVSIFGLYFSLLYLSLSDATVLTFVAPILTVFAGAIFLKETLSLKDTCAGCMYSMETISII